MNNMPYRYLDHPSYTDQQLALLKAEMNEKYHIAFDLAVRCGLRLFEIATLDYDQCNNEYFFLRKGIKVQIKLPEDLIQKIEKNKSELPVITHDHNCEFSSYYALNAGRSFATTLSNASHTLFGYSLGTNALRVTYSHKAFHRLAQFQSPQKVIAKLKAQLGSLAK
ncbi:hypothetical protein [Photobacterium leiognathi]|uniref:hypothetical protein n=1 Tax=Photobacterium leiognathi TaxID=553611 RepID=UPI002980A488|nr:hypothetical protein [Photobacterium leiognathi]